MKAKFLIPLALFAVLVAFLLVGLNRDPRDVPSPLVNKSAPAFSAPQLEQPELNFSPSDLRGKVWMLNVWASWCVGCREEHPVLLAFSRTRTLPIIGLDYKEKKSVDGLTFLRTHGNPFDIIAQDLDGRIGIDYGVYGVPESYIIDKQGVIRFKQTGPITPEILQSTIMPLINELKKS
jgi:cytochrome c biogenesis protein CcmG/thiol:disulfide interchange protein DsbE